MYSIFMVLENLVGSSLDLRVPEKTDFTLAGLSGKVVEISGWEHPAGLSLAASFIQECQGKGGLAAWISPRCGNRGTLFFPPDFEDRGIDCNSLPILWTASAADGFSIADRLLRSRAFDMLVVDLTGVRQPRPAGGLGRLHRGARDSGCLVLCLTRRRPGESSLDPMVFVHLHGFSQAAEPEGFFDVSITVQKDKNHAPGRIFRRRYGSPVGLP